jgi:hypothetical protein
MAWCSFILDVTVVRIVVLCLIVILDVAYGFICCVVRVMVHRGWRVHWLMHHMVDWIVMNNRYWLVYHWNWLGHDDGLHNDGFMQPVICGRMYSRVTLADDGIKSIYTVCCVVDGAYRAIRFH